MSKIIKQLAIKHNDPRVCLNIIERDGGTVYGGVYIYVHMAMGH